MILGEAIEKITPSDRIVIVNAAGHVIYRGFAANAKSAGIRQTRRVKKYGIGLETYRATENMWDWKKLTHCHHKCQLNSSGNTRWIN